MFQNISKVLENKIDERIKSPKEGFQKEMLKEIFKIQNIVIYILALMVSMVGFSEKMEIMIAPFAISLVAAALSCKMPIVIVYVMTLIGTGIKHGTEGLVIYFLASAVFFLCTLIKRPREQEDVNEQRRVGKHLIISMILVQLVYMVIKGFYLYDFLMMIITTASSFILYKVFVNSMPVIKNYGEKKVFSVEEVVGVSIFLTIAINAFGDFKVLGFSIRNILSILIVLILGWKNGILVGGTAGITIGVIVGVLGDAEPMVIAAYALSGMIAGVLNRFGKIGVAIGFVLGNVTIAYITNGGTTDYILLKEILIASIGLFAIPKNIKLDIEDLVGKHMMLPEGGRQLEESPETIFKLNNISDTIKEMARTYSEAGIAVVEEEEIIKQKEKDFELFYEEFKDNLEGLEGNILYDDVYNNEDLVRDVFKILLDDEVIIEKQLIEILQNHNIYVISYNDSKIDKQDLDEINQIAKTINASYRACKIDFIWKKKMQENKRTVSTQLEGVSKVISDLVKDMEKTPENTYQKQKEEILELLKAKQIEIQDLTIKKEDNERSNVNVYTKICDHEDGTNCPVNSIARIISKVLDEKMLLQSQDCGLRNNKETCTYTYMAEDKYHIQIGIETAKKDDSTTSGDSISKTRLEDGKYLIAMSDGMGSGDLAKKNSKTAISMLEKLLTSGFDKDTSLKLINSTISLSNEEDMYATLDIQILDLYSGNIEFIKNGAMPTYIKRNGKVQVLKSSSLPAGILEEVDLVEYDKDLEDGDIIVMCSDGIIDSNKEYTNKELWLQYLLEEISTDDATRIANIIIHEAIDNGYGTKQDDMTVIVTKVNKKDQNK